ETLDELKKKKKEQLEEQKQQNAENAKRDTLIQKATENAEVEIPEVMVETELDQMLREFEQNLQMQGMTMDMYQQFTGQDEEELKEQIKEKKKENDGKRVKTNLTMEAIVQQEEIEVSDEEIDEELEKMASMYQTEVDQLKQMLGGQTDALKQDLKIRKAIEFLVEH